MTLKRNILITLLAASLFIPALVLVAPRASAASNPTIVCSTAGDGTKTCASCTGSGAARLCVPTTEAAHFCGAGDNRIRTSIDFGCRGQGNAILDLTFAVIRFLSIGVGLVIIGSIIVAGIQYTASRGDPQATAKALARVYSSVGALILFMFSYAILNWLIPAGLLR